MKRAPWKQLQTETVFESKLFRMRQDRLELPDGRVMPRYFVIEFPDWVNIVPITKDGEIVMVEQYRHATQEYTLELPGGSTDPYRNETPQQAALREMTEETGYTAGRVVFLAKQAPNPALQSNHAHSFLALDCELTQAPQLDPFEDIQIVTKPVREIYRMVMKGEINHSIIVAALLYALPHLGLRLEDLK